MGASRAAVVDVEDRLVPPREDTVSPATALAAALSGYTAVARHAPLVFGPLGDTYQLAAKWGARSTTESRD